MNGILVAGIGNIFLGDDGFGSEAARLLLQRPVQAGVRVVDFGIRGLDLAYALMHEYAAVIIIDTMQRGGEHGTLYVIDPQLEDAASPELLDAHSVDPVRTLSFARSMGATLKNIRIVGCEPESFGPADEGRMGLSPCVAAALQPAVEIVESLIAELKQKETLV
jgi:hydrogenase maturation protease